MPQRLLCTDFLKPPNGSMMSIVRGERNGIGFDPTIYHASLVQTKYGFTTKHLTTMSWECQKKYGTFEYDLHLSRLVNIFQSDFWCSLEAFELILIYFLTFHRARSVNVGIQQVFTTWRYKLNAL
jgi:hypothetical protein